MKVFKFVLEHSTATTRPILVEIPDDSHGLTHVFPRLRDHFGISKSQLFSLRERIDGRVVRALNVSIPVRDLGLKNLAVLVLRIETCTYGVNIDIGPSTVEPASSVADSFANPLCVLASV
eukprot:ANDGO_00554.mRNA.1 hypothetical protein